jgi:hypothetical protein
VLLLVLFLARRENARPLQGNERELWIIIRAQGKRRYLLRSVTFGLFAGVLFLLYQLLKARRSGVPFRISFDFILIAFFVLIYIGGSYYAAIRKWTLYEDRYRETFPSESQHDKSFEGTSQ